MDNNPALWHKMLPIPSASTHKYKRGHAVILGGKLMTGAARLASLAAMRMGAGVCTIIAAAEAGPAYQSGAPHILYEPLGNDYAQHLADSRRNAVLLGPGYGQEGAAFLRQAVLDSIGDHKRAVVLDADALTVFSDRTELLFPALHDRCVLTPHLGEFSRLFPEIDGDPLRQAASAAILSGAIIVLKGAQTIIAHPDGRVVVNHHATPYLATAGAGDVLAGMITGLLAQPMPAYEACCAGVWIHGDAGLRFGPGLVATDLIAEIPGILRELT